MSIEIVLIILALILGGIGLLVGASARSAIGLPRDPSAEHPRSSPRGFGERLPRMVIFVSLVAILATACGEDQQATPPETTTTTTVPATTTVQAEATTTAAGGDGTAGTLSIDIAAFEFSGDEAGSVGDTVEVTNSDSVTHTWTSVDGEFDSGVIGTGETFTHTFDDAGTYSYFCEIHPGMTGNITIEG